MALKNCPFCGEQPVVISYPYGINKGMYKTIHCCPMVGCIEIHGFSEKPHAGKWNNRVETGIEKLACDDCANKAACTKYQQGGRMIAGKCKGYAKEKTERGN